MEAANGHASLPSQSIADALQLQRSQAEQCLLSQNPKHQCRQSICHLYTELDSHAYEHQLSLILLPAAVKDSVKLVKNVCVRHTTYTMVSARKILATSVL